MIPEQGIKAMLGRVSNVILRNLGLSSSSGENP